MERDADDELATVPKFRLLANEERIFGKSEFIALLRNDNIGNDNSGNDTNSVNNSEQTIAKYVMKNHAKIARLEDRSIVCSIMNEKCSLFLFRENDDESVWEKVEYGERERRFDDARCFSFFAPKFWPDDRTIKSVKRDLFRREELVEGGFFIEEREQKCLVLLCGTSGAGKSTMAMTLNKKKFTRVNQDTIGTRGECIDLARRALLRGRNVVIDRTNLSIAQRNFFITVLRECENAMKKKIILICVNFDLPLSVRQNRVLHRKEHEGEVQGKSGVRIVTMQNSKKDNARPTKLEGFDKIFHCRTDEEISKATNEIKAMTGGDLPPYPPLLESDNDIVEEKFHQNHHQQQLGIDVGGFGGGGGHFQLDGLLRKQKDPENMCASGELIKLSEKCFAIYDLYPKAKFHALVLPRSDKMRHPFDFFKQQDVGGMTLSERSSIAMEMYSVALDILKNEQNRLPRGTKFKIGFHLKPSMEPAHLHVISQDFDSARMKTKIHWHSFTNDDFFVDFFKAANKTEWNASLSEHIVKSNDLRCHKCKEKCTNMPQLKSHIFSCGCEQPGKIFEEMIEAFNNNQTNASTTIIMDMD